MNDLNAKGSGFSSKAAALLNCKDFSDLEIQVFDRAQIVRSFSAHKLFLAMNSQEFARMFYTSSTSPRVITIKDFKPKVVFMMLEFLYTEKVNLSDTNEARELYTLAKKYWIRQLQELCVDHIAKEQMSEDNVLSMYEFAYVDKYLNCLDLCRQFVSSNTSAVIESPSFVKTSLQVILDILKQDTLTVDSELDIIFAVIKWAFHECNRRNLTKVEQLRDCIYPLLRHVRFLNLKPKEFCDIVQKYPILTPRESNLIKRKLVQPEEYVSLPRHICQIKKPRIYLTEFDIKTEIKTEDLNSALFNLSSSSAYVSYPLGSKKLKKCPVSKVAPQINLSGRKTYEFCLEEAEKLLSTAFKNDVKCSVSMDLLKGVVIVHGIELIISQGPRSGEIVRVFLYALNKESVSDTFNEELKDGVITLSFSKPMKIVEGDHAMIEVTIEDLKLSRCCIVKDRVCRLNFGSDVVADMSLTSNQVNETGEQFFLISRLIMS